jgi:hypothetical protein
MVSTMDCGAFCFGDTVNRENPNSEIGGEWF